MINIRGLMDEPSMKKEYVNKLVKRLGITEGRLYAKYDKFSTYCLRLMGAVMISGAVVYCNRDVKRYEIERYQKPIETSGYEEAIYRLKKAKEAYNIEARLNTPLDNASSDSRIEKLAAMNKDIQELQVEAADFYNSKENQNYQLRLRNTTKAKLIDLGITILVAGAFAGIKCHYDSKKKKILHRKMTRLRVIN